MSLTIQKMLQVESLCIWVHPSNASSLIEIVKDWISTCFNSEQSLNAKFSIDDTDKGIFIFFNFEHFQSGVC